MQDRLKDISIDTLDAVAGGIARAHFTPAHAPAQMPMPGYGGPDAGLDASMFQGAQTAPRGPLGHYGWNHGPTAAPQGGLPAGLSELYGPQGFFPAQQQAPRAPVAAPRAAAPQANPLTQIQQGLGMANQAMGLAKQLGGLFGGGGSPGGGAQGGQQGGQQGGDMFGGGQEGQGQQDFGGGDFGGGDFGGGDFGGGDFGGF